jgi:hypothetical protein
MNCEFVNPLVDPDWNRSILEFSDATVFHSSQWAQVLAESYGYRPVYAVARVAGRAAAIVPIMEVRSFWTGRRGVCLPFSDECAPLTNGITLQTVVESIRAFGLENGWDYLELRGGREAVPLANQSDEFLSHQLALDSREDAQFSRLRDSTRRNIQKARREGVEIHHLRTRDAIDSFYSLHCGTRRRHGLPPQPVKFFHLIHKFLIDAGHGFISLARVEGQWIAGAVYFQFGARSVYKFGASDPKFQHLRANNLLMWEAICELRKRGASSLSLGRSDPHDNGLLQFKRGWGSEEAALPYYRVALRKDSGIAKSQSSRSHETLTLKVMRHLPLPVLRMIGTVVYRHVG